VIRESASGKQIGIILVALVVLCSSTLACGPTSTPTVIVSTKIVQVKITGTPKIVTSTPPPTPTPTLTPTPTIPPTIDPRWTTYTTADGLADNRVYFVVAAPNGTLWCGSYGGVSRFDGETWTTYALDEQAYLLPEPHIYAASNDSLWIANGFAGREGVLRFDGETWTTYTTDDGLVDNNAYAVTVAPDGIVWISTVSGISRFDGETWTTFTTEDGLASNAVQFVIAAPSGTIFAFTDEGISYFDGKTWTTFFKLETSNWGLVVIDYEDALWIGGGESIYRLDRKGVTTYNMQDGVPGTFITALALGIDGAIWIGTNGGAARFDRETWSAYTTANGLAGDYVISIAVTPDGAVWFGTMSDGLSRYKP
jgi:ligand-binding sensor domain-containing protein